VWKQCNQISKQTVLTNAGISELRSTLRIEAKERQDSVLKFLAVLTGVIGVVTGLILLFK
jgi:hypothetical protein